MKNYIVISILLFICTMVNAQIPTGFVKPKYKQPGVYVTYQDFLDDKPILGKKLTRTKGRGVGNWILEMEDGSKRKFEADSIWGTLRPCWNHIEDFYKAKCEYYTPCRGGGSPVFMYGAVWLYGDVDASYYYYPQGDSFVFYTNNDIGFSIGPEGKKWYASEMEANGQLSLVMLGLSNGKKYFDFVSQLDKDAWKKVQEYRGYFTPDSGEEAAYFKLDGRKVIETKWYTEAQKTGYAILYRDLFRDGKDILAYRVFEPISFTLLEYYNNIMAGKPQTPLTNKYGFDVPRSGGPSLGTTGSYTSVLVPKPLTDVQEIKKD